MMKNKFFFLFTFIIFFSCSLNAKNEPLVCNAYPLSRVQVRHREHHGVGWDKGYSTFAAYLTPRNNLFFLPFLDARLHVFNDGDLASNLGFGTRLATSSNQLIFGLNAYYDFRELSSFSSHQASLGFEVLSDSVDFRLNGYYPFSGKTKEEDVYFNTFKGNNVLFKQQILYSLPSADGEIGFFLPEPMKQIKLYLALGAYYLFKQQAYHHSIGNAPGFKTRLTATPEDWISFSVEYTKDRLFHNRVNGYVSFNIPLGKKETPVKKKSKYYKHRDPCKAYYAAMERKTQDPYHNEIIPFYHEKHLFSPINTSTGVAHRFIFVNNKTLDSAEIGSGSGTYEDPYTTLKLGEKNSGPNDIIFVLYGKGNDSGYNKGFIFQEGQLLTSGSVPIFLQGYYIPPLEPGLNPYVSNQKASGLPTIYGQDLNQIYLQGFNISSTLASTMKIENVGAIINNNIFKAPFGYLSLQHTFPKETSISENTFITAGVQVRGGVAANSYSIDRNQFSLSSEFVGIDLENIAKNISVTNNTFESRYSSAIPAAISYQAPVYLDNLDSFHISYRNNQITSGIFTSGIYHTCDIDEVESVVVANNILISKNLNYGFQYLTNSNNGSLLVSENQFDANLIGVLIDNNGINHKSYLQKNTITAPQTTSSCYGIDYTTSEPSTININQNSVSAYGAIAINSALSKIGLVSLNISDNNIVSNHFPLAITNQFVGSTYGSVLNNSHTGTNSSALGFFSIQNGNGNICINFKDNTTSYPEGTFNLTLNNTGSGKFQMSTIDPPSATSLEKQNTNIKVETTGTITFASEGSNCPPVRPTLYVNSSNTKPNPDGSLSNPFPTIGAAIEKSDVGDLIFVFPGNGYVENVVLKDDQILASSGASFTLDNISYSPTTGYPNLGVSNQNPIVTSANNNKIYGFQFLISNQSTGIQSQNIDIIEIDQNGFNLLLAQTGMLLNTQTGSITNCKMTTGNVSDKFINIQARANQQSIKVNNNSFTYTQTVQPVIVIDSSTAGISSFVQFNNNAFLSTGVSTGFANIIINQLGSDSSQEMKQNVFNSKNSVVLSSNQQSTTNTYSFNDNNLFSGDISISSELKDSSKINTSNNLNYSPAGSYDFSASINTGCFTQVKGNTLDYKIDNRSGSLSSSAYLPNTQNASTLNSDNPGSTFTIMPGVSVNYSSPCP